MSQHSQRAERRRAARVARSRRQRNAVSRDQLLVVAVIAAAAVVALVAIGGVAGPAPASSSAPGIVQSGHARGAADAPVTIEEWADFQCPACGQFARITVPQLLNAYVATGKVRLVFHDFAFLGAESGWAAEAADCANEQGRFFEYHDRLFATQAGENRGAFSKDNLRRIGADLGLGAAFASCVDSGRHAQAVRDETRAGTERGVKATPTLFVNGRKIEGAATFDQLRAIIDPILASR